MSEQPSQQPWGQDVCEVTRNLDEVPPSDVRQLVRTLLDGRDGMIVDDAVLVTDELVTNALRHGGAPRSCRLTLTDSGATLRIEVDDSAAAPPRFREPDSTGGRGLLLIDQLASAWGVERHDYGKTVWAEMAMAGSPARHLSAASDR
jgi:two-component sensor histidine kinase